jgi:hypothetical protein
MFAPSLLHPSTTQRKRLLSVLVGIFSPGIAYETDHTVNYVPCGEKCNTFQCKTMEFVEQFCDKKRQQKDWRLF